MRLTSKSYQTNPYKNESSVVQQDNLNYLNKSRFVSHDRLIREVETLRSKYGGNVASITKREPKDNQPKKGND